MSGFDLSDPERSSQQLSEVLQHFQVEVGGEGQACPKKIVGTIIRILGLHSALRAYFGARWLTRSRIPLLDSARILFLTRS
jgi:hypothetical protein